MTVEQAVNQYGGAGLLIWVATLVIPVIVAQWRAGVRADARTRDVINQERKVINGLLEKRDADARVLTEKTEVLEAELHLIRSAMDDERESSARTVADLQQQLSESRRIAGELEQRLTDSEQAYQIQLHSAEVQIDGLQQEVDALKAQLRAINDEKQSLVTRLFDELKTVARITGELEFLKGERVFAERVLAKIASATYVEPGVIYTPFSPV